MIKAFVDTDILVSVLNKEYPLFSFTSRILSLADNSRFRICTSPVCLAFAFHFAEKKNNTTARSKLELLSRHIEIIEITSAAALSAISDSRILELEDSLEYYAALQAGCGCIITEGKKDFYPSTNIEVLSSLEFYEQHMPHLPQITPF